jgi:uncharacterized protein YdbL (DUF1318 family)
MHASSFCRLGLFVAAVLCAAPVLPAQDLATVRARMEQRLPSVLALKDRQAVGENNRGYLEVRGQVGGADQQVVSDENSDRRRVYTAIAGQTGSSADEVGRKRAAQLADLARPGHWIQDAAGTWRKK